MNIIVDLTVDIDKVLSSSTTNLFDPSTSGEETILTFPYWKDVSFPGHCVNIVNREANTLFNPWFSKMQYQLGEDVEIKIKSTENSSIESTVLGKVASLVDNFSCEIETFSNDTSNRYVLVNIKDMRPFVADDRMLNDSLVEFGILHALHQSISNDPTISKFYFVGTKMYTKFLEYLDRHNCQHLAYKQVHRWTKHVDIFSKEVILFPIHENTHWYLIAFCNIGSLLAHVVCTPRTTVDDHALIFVMDSLPKKLDYYKQHIINLCSYLSLEYFAKKMNTLQVATTGLGIPDLKKAFKKVPRFILNSPTQPNGYDCGMYLIRNCRNLIENYSSLKIGDLHKISSEKTISPLFDYNNEDIQKDRTLMYDVIVSTYEESIKYVKPQPHDEEDPKKKNMCEQDFITPKEFTETEATTVTDILTHENISGNSGKRKASAIVDEESLPKKKESVNSPYIGYNDYDFFNLSFMK